MKASDVQSHAWYHEMFAGTLCGRWTRVDSIVNGVPLDGLEDLDRPVCTICLQKSRRFAH